MQWLPQCRSHRFLPRKWARECRGQRPLPRKNVTMQPPQSTILLISSQHPTWVDLRLSLEGWLHGQVVGDVQQAAEAIALASALQPRVILVDADAPDRPLISFVGDLRAASPRAGSWCSAHEKRWTTMCSWCSGIVASPAISCGRAC